MKRMILSAVVVLSTLVPTMAQEDDTRWIRKAIGRAQVCAWDGSCRWEYRYGWVRVPSYSHYWRAPVYTHPTRVYGYIGYGEADKAPRCATLPNSHVPLKISAVGVEAYDKAKARERAEQAWAEIVRARVAGRYMDIGNAEGAVYECWKSSTGNRASEKAADEFGKELHQCNLEAVPCRGRQEVADNDDPTTDAAIRRLRALGYDVELRAPTDPDAPKKPRIIRRLFPKKE